MNPGKLFVLLALAVMASGRDDTVQRSQQQYDVVQEGSTQGVTSTINAPGEATPPPAATTITGTNVDTTTAFSLPATAATATGTCAPDREDIAAAATNSLTANRRFPCE